MGSLDYKDEMNQQLLDMGCSEDRICKPLLAFKGWQYFDYFEPNSTEIFVDAGCFDGKTAFDFTKWTCNKYDYIYSFEPNSYAIKNCKNFFKNNDLKGEVVNKGLWNKRDKLHFSIDPNSKVAGDSPSSAARIIENGESVIETIALDEFLNGNKVTFIKMDIEGSEYNALLGAKKTIKKWHPRLAICIYHKPEDILEIPSLLIEIQYDYKFALRSYCSRGTETVLYAY